MKRALKGKGPTPPAEDRKGHPAARRAAAAERRAGSSPGRSPRDAPQAELLVGRNPVAEALRAKVPATALYLAQGLETDERVTEAVRIAGNRGIALLEVVAHELDRRTGGILHQGIALQVPPFAYHELPDLLRQADESGTPPLLVALDGVTDPRNLGAVIRSALAFGAHGRDHPGAALGRRHGDGVADVGRYGRAAAGRAGDQPGARAEGLPRRRHVRHRPRRRRHDVARRAARWRPSRSWSWSWARRAAGCPGWSARPAT